MKPIISNNKTRTSTGYLYITQTHTCACTHTHTHTHAHAHTHTNTLSHTHTNTHTHTHPHSHTLTYSHTSTHSHTHIPSRLCTLVQMFTHILDRNYSIKSSCFSLYSYTALRLTRSKLTSTTTTTISHLKSVPETDMASGDVDENLRHKPRADFAVHSTAKVFPSISNLFQRNHACADTYTWKQCQQ